MARINKKIKKNKDKNLHNSFYHTIIAQRAAKELEKKEREFKEAHAGDKDTDLILYVCHEALKLGHAPREKEIVGWKYLLERFGSWDRIITRARLKPYFGGEPEYEYALIKDERDRQVKLHKQRMHRRKQLAAQRRIRQEQKRKEEEAYRAEHPEARKKKRKKLKPQTEDTPDTT